MNWLTCSNCGSKRVHLTTENRHNKCSCCGGDKRTQEFGWFVWCNDCDQWTELHDTPQEAIEAFDSEDTKNVGDLECLK